MRIEFKDVKFEYNQKDKALNGVSFDVEDGSWVSIIGHNGSGKSTIAKLLVGLVFPNSGEILFDGVKLDESNLNMIRRKVGIVFQNPDNQFVGYNVKYDIAFGLENHNVPREEMLKLIDEYTKKVDMDKFIDREPTSLSGGQKQRVAIAGILALNSDVIILDEATSMLDPEGVEDIENLIEELHKNYHKTIITITHDLSLAQKSDEVIVLKDGLIIGEGKPEDILKDEKLLKSTSLDMPFSLKVYGEAMSIDCLKNDERLMEALWEYRLKM